MSANPETLVHTIQDFIDASNRAVILEDGAMLFELNESKYSLSADRGRCLLHIWSAERNIVRRVVDAETKNDVLRLTVQNLGQLRPTKLEIARGRDLRSPSTKRMQRARYRSVLERVLQRDFTGFKINDLRMSRDLERSFGPVYARGFLHRGNAGFAVLGVNDAEAQASIDGALTFGILWLDYLRQRNAGRINVGGLKLFVPSKRSATVRERISCLNRAAASWEIFEVDEKHETQKRIDSSDRGNISTRLVRAADKWSTLSRFADSTQQMKRYIEQFDTVILSSAEVSFRVNGLEFARARVSFGAGLASGQEIVFGVGRSETVLDDHSDSFFRHLVARLESRRGDVHLAKDLVWRLVPERWLESLVVKDVSKLDSRLDSRFVYSQVPAFSASDRAMIDVLTVTGDRRLAIVELKADEDIHLPMQGLDYWARVSWHHSRNEFPSYGYFNDVILSDSTPLLFLVAPALHIHPQTDTLLRYFDRSIEWELIAVDEHWRKEVRTVFRKRPCLQSSVYNPASLPRNSQ